MGENLKYIIKIYGKVEKKMLNICRAYYSRKSNSPFFFQTTISTENVSSYIKQNLLSDKPFMISRFGSTEFDCTVYPYLLQQSIFSRYKLYISGLIDVYRRKKEYEELLINTLCNNAGFFPIDSQKLSDFSDLMMTDLKEVDVLGVWLKENIFTEQLKNKQLVTLESLEPYFYSKPWTDALVGKKVLVVHPFKKTIEEQYKKRNLLFKNKNVLPDFELKTIKAIQTSAGESCEFDTWFAALDSMKEQISNVDFDIAIIGCGAYGFPLAAHVKRLGKKAIHLGGATQILFGIKGKRWESIPGIAELMNEHWVRPLPEETPQQSMTIEDGCYW